MKLSKVLFLSCVTLVHSTTSNFEEKQITKSSTHQLRFLRRNDNNQMRNNKKDSKKYCKQYFQDYKKQNDLNVNNDETMEECTSTYYKAMEETINSAEKVYDSEVEYAKKIYEEEVKAAEEIYDSAIKSADWNFKNETKDFASDLQYAEQAAAKTFKSDMNSYINSYFSSYSFSAYQLSSSSSSSGLVAASGVMGMASVAAVYGVMHRHRSMVASADKDLLDREGAYTAPDDGALAWEAFLRGKMTPGP